MIKAIETVYRGYRFRSRLEARWAVFFDALQIEWEYESECLDLGRSYGKYLPDFWLPTFNGGMFAEVKPHGGDVTKPRALLHHGPPGTRVWFCIGTPSTSIYFHGEAYRPSPGVCAATEFEYYCGIPKWGPAKDENRMYSTPCELAETCMDRCPREEGDRQSVIPIPIADQNIAEWCYREENGITVPVLFLHAVLQARQARFEWGQVGAPMDWGG